MTRSAHLQSTHQWRPGQVHAGQHAWGVGVGSRDVCPPPREHLDLRVSWSTRRAEIQ